MQELGVCALLSYGVTSSATYSIADQRTLNLLHMMQLIICRSHLFCLIDLSVPDFILVAFVVPKLTFHGLNV